jgi:phosphatidylserine/phosphatidylglycerophosphate/cardiolipin synthase-like enzyme
MDLLKSAPEKGKKLVWVRAYKGDAMTLLAFDLHESKLENFVGFSIHIKANNVNGKFKLDYYLLNRITFPKEILDKNGIDNYEALSSKYSPFQKFNWVHVPSTDHNLNNPYFGDYTYIVSPRYLVDGILQEEDPSLTVEVTIDVSPFDTNLTKIGFARAFISSLAYVRRFGMNNQVRPGDNKLMFNVNDESGYTESTDRVTKQKVKHPYKYIEQHKYLGWQARMRVMEFLDEVVSSPPSDKMTLEVFAYDLNEPEIARKLLTLAQSGKLRIILDNEGSHGKAEGYEGQFEKAFNESARGGSEIKRGRFAALSHSKVMILKKDGKAVKVLTGSTNFSTNGLYVNANHIIIFDNPEVAQVYSDVFEKSFGQELMNQFRNTRYAKDDFLFASQDMTIRFSPHTKEVAQQLFEKISGKIKGACTDVLFAIMKDNSKSSILDAVRVQLNNPEVFTYGITDSVGKEKDSVMVYKPNTKRGVRVAAKGTNVTNVLPPPFNTVPKIDGYAIHHKFVVVDFKGPNPAVFCGSSNLAFDPEQKNGDNLIEIRNRDIVTAFAIEAFRLTEHFHWRNKEQTGAAKNKTIELKLTAKKDLWYKKYYNPKDLRCIERGLFISEPKKKKPQIPD